MPSGLARMRQPAQINSYLLLQTVGKEKGLSGIGGREREIKRGRERGRERELVNVQVKQMPGNKAINSM